MAQCKFCGREIDWIASPEGKYIPVDPDPVFVIEGGADVFLDDMGETITGRRARTHEESRDLPVAFVPHLRTCPNYEPRADQFSGGMVQAVKRKKGEYEAAMERCATIVAKYELDMEEMRREAARLALSRKMSHAEALCYIADERAREAATKRGGGYG